MDCIEKPRCGLSIGIDAHILHDALSAHTPGLLLVAYPKLTCASPFQAFFAFTDGSFRPTNTRVSWAVVCLGLQDSRIVRVGCLAGLLAGEQALGAQAYAGEAEAILHARAALLASGAPILHLGFDCSSALAACSGLQQCPPPWNPL